MAILPSKMPAKNIIATSTMELNEYTVYFVADGVKVGEYTGRYTFPIEYPENPTKEGYVFSRWDQYITTMPIGGATINAVFKKDAGDGAYTVTYKFCVERNNGGALEYSEPYYYETQEYMPGETIIPPARPDLDGYCCNMSWADLPNIMPAHDVTAMLYYDLLSFTVKFIVDGATVGSYTGKYSTPIIYPVDPVKEGYIFTGWTPNLATVPLMGGNINATFQAADEPDVPVSEHLFIKMETLEGIADAVREKAGTSGKFPVSEIKDRILALTTACEAISALYLADKITIDDVRQSVVDGLITAEDYKKITGDDYAS